jgi:hypothetical protein
MINLRYNTHTDIFVILREYVTSENVLIFFFNKESKLHRKGKRVERRGEEGRGGK